MLEMHAFVSGRVQFVGFRYGVWLRARELKLSGWVKNLSDGRVEACFYGSIQELESIKDFLWIGPSVARVDNVDVQFNETASPETKGFRILG